MSQCPNPNCLHQNLSNTKFCVKCGNKLCLSDRLSQEQDNLVKGANVGRDLTFAPVQNIIETQIMAEIEGSCDEVQPVAETFCPYTFQHLNCCF